MSGLSPVGQGAAASPTLGLTPQMQSAAQSTAFGNIGGLQQFQTSNIPQATALTQNIANNPYAQTFQQGANTTGANASAASGNLFGAGNQVLQTAMDPQQQLYNRYLQQTEQQFQATNAQSGVASTPYAAGLNAQNLQNFNISWQAQQLANQIAGLNAAGGAYGTATNLGQAGAQLPFSTYNAIQQAPLAALSGLQQYGLTGSAVNQQQISDYMSLLGLQPSLSGAQNQTALTQSQLQQTMVNQLGGGIGALLGLGMGGMGMGGMGGLGGLGGLLGGSAAYGGGSAFAGDAYGGNAFAPLPGLTAEDYG